MVRDSEGARRQELADPRQHPAAGSDARRAGDALTGSGTIADLLTDARRQLAGAPFEASGREAALLLGHVLGWTEAQVLARTERVLEPGQLDRFEALLGRRLNGEPFAYLTGEREFFGRRFHVDPRVLIPRPETEHLVEAALGLHLPEDPRILDLGTGSGCIAVTLALELAGARVTATDRSLAALSVARLNARHLGARVQLVAADLAAGIEISSFDLVVSNPPYVDPADAGTLSPEVTEFEPAAALFSEKGGTSAIEGLLGGVGKARPGTPLLLEIGQGQAEAVEELAAASPFELVEIRPDYARIPRVAMLRRGRAQAT